LLRAAGIDAVIACNDPQPPGWFESTAPMIDMSRDVRPNDDVLVFPENHQGMLQQFAEYANPKVVYCQNQFMIYRGCADGKGYDAYGVSDVLCSGTFATRFCRRRFPKLKVDYVPHFINHDLFKLQQEKKLQIVAAPRKRAAEWNCIRDLFRAENPQWNHVPWICLQGVTSMEVARIMRESALCLVLSRYESFGAVPLEALACGCIVAGFTGWGGREFATHLSGFWAEEDDCEGCVDELTKAVQTVVDQGTEFHSRIRAGLDTASLYTPQRASPRLVDYWKRFL
jgi:hypothetical protein